MVIIRLWGSYNGKDPRFLPTFFSCLSILVPGTFVLMAAFPRLCFDHLLMCQDFEWRLFWWLLSLCCWWFLLLMYSFSFWTPLREWRHLVLISNEFWPRSKLHDINCSLIHNMCHICLFCCSFNQFSHHGLIATPWT